MNYYHQTLRRTPEVSVWRLTGKLVVLAGVLMAYSYCLLLTIGSILKMVNS
jgi:hypothetical protein